MPSSYIETNFDERSGFVPCITEWGMWWQTVNEVHIEINVPPGTKPKDITLLIKKREISVNVSSKELLKVSSKNILI